jgi:hypothetical protein
MLANPWGSITCPEKVGNVMILKNRGGKGGNYMSATRVWPPPSRNPTLLAKSERRKAKSEERKRTADPSARAEALGRDDTVDKD